MRWRNHGLAGAPRPSAESIKTDRTAGVSPVQFNNICLPALSFPLRIPRFQIDGIVAARSPIRLWMAARDVAVHPGELFFLLEERLLREWDQHIMVNLPI